MIDACYPSANQFIKNERKTLEFLINDPLVNTNFPDLCVEAKRALYDGPPEVLAFESHVDLDVERHTRRVHFGAHIVANKTKYEKVSYYIAFCKGARSCGGFLRKFHFDYVPTQERGKHFSLKPVFHLQYCGTLSPRLGTYGFKDKGM